MTPPRSRSQRREDTLARLRGTYQLYIATASPEDPAPRLVPVSFAWTGEALIIATGLDTVTGRNLERSGIARLAVGPTDDVVLIDVRVKERVGVEQAPPALADAYAAQSDWDPRNGTDVPTAYFVLEPVRIQAWRETAEVPGRTIMRAGRWLPDS
jgi:hypothetical protein